MPWPASGLITAPPPAEFKQNGMRFAPPPPPYTGGINNKRQQHNFIEQMQSMSLVDGDNPLHNSNSSSNSSPNQTPPGTPSSTIAGNIDGGAAAAAAAAAAATVAVAAKGRLNGIQFGPAPGTAICDAISPPPPQPPTAAAAAAAPSIVLCLTVIPSHFHRYHHNRQGHSYVIHLYIDNHLLLNIQQLIRLTIHFHHIIYLM